MKPRIRAMIAHFNRSMNKEYIYYEREFDTWDGGDYRNLQLIERINSKDFLLFLEGIYEDKYQTV